MARSRATYRRIRTRRIRAVGLLVVLAAVAATLGFGLPASSSTDAGLSGPVRATGEPRAGRNEALGEAGGDLPRRTTVYDVWLPGVANVDPALLAALRQAATDAAYVGVELFVDSGWRSAAYQRELLREAVSKYGSEEEAARWVAGPTTSAHVSGDAVDVGPSDAAAWLSGHGAVYGLCPVYRNEPWHYELRPEARARGCPPMYADAASR